MTAPVKFLFEDDFAASDVVNPARRTIPLAAHEAALAEAAATAYRNGFAAAKADAENRVTAACERIAVLLQQIAQGLKAVEDRLEAEAVEVAVAVARKLAPELIAREPLAEIAALAADCFRHVVAAPHVVVRVADGSIYEATRARLDEIARAHSFDGRLVVLAEPGLGPGDCRIEWADGGIVRDRAETETEICEMVDRYVAVRRTNASAA